MVKVKVEGPGADIVSQLIANALKEAGLNEHVVRLRASRGGLLSAQGRDR